MNFQENVVLLDGTAGGRWDEYVPPPGPRRRGDPAQAALKGRILDALQASHAL